MLLLIVNNTDLVLFKIATTLKYSLKIALCLNITLKQLRSSLNTSDNVVFKNNVKLTIKEFDIYGESSNSK